MRNQNNGATQSSGVPRRRAIRLGQLITTVRTVLTLLLALVIAIAGLASLDNALAPAIPLAHAADGPAALSLVRALEYDAQHNALYAATNAGVFKSTDGGLNWLPASNGLSGVDVQ